MIIKINNTSLPRCVCGGLARYVLTRYDGCVAKHSDHWTKEVDEYYTRGVSV